MMRIALREPLFWLLALVYLTWFLCSVAYGQSGRGVFIRQSCASITNPVENETYCFHSGPTTGVFTQGELHLYVSGNWTCKTCAVSDRTIEQVFSVGRIATNLDGFANRAQFGDAVDQGVSFYSDGVLAPARMTCVVGGVEDACDKVVGLKSGFKWAIQNEDGDDIISVAEDGTLTGFSGGSSDVGAHVYHNTDQTIANDTVSFLAFNSERKDTSSFHDNASQNSRLTAPSNGTYIITASVNFAHDPDGYRDVCIRLNNTVNLQCHRGMAVTESTIQTALTVSTIYDLTTSDYVEVRIIQTSGGDLDVLSIGNQSPEFRIQKIPYS